MDCETDEMSRASHIPYAEEKPLVWLHKIIFSQSDL